MFAGAGMSVRQAVSFARPWQRALLGAAALGAGVALGVPLLTVLGGVLLAGGAYGGLRAWRVRKNAPARPTELTAERLTSERQNP
jgi:hypothetical protein